LVVKEGKGEETDRLLLQKGGRERSYVGTCQRRERVAARRIARGEKKRASEKKKAAS